MNPENKIEWQKHVPQLIGVGDEWQDWNSPYKKELLKMVNEYAEYCSYYGPTNVTVYFIPNRFVFYVVSAPNGVYDRYDLDRKHLDDWEIESAEKWDLHDLVNLFDDKFSEDLKHDVITRNK